MGEKGNQGRQEGQVDDMTDLILLQHHEIKVANAFVEVVLHPFRESCMADDFSDVFIYESVSVKRRA